jgi:predicted RNase H-like nuclease (RuvC/YqgF family)
MLEKLEVMLQKITTLEQELRKQQEERLKDREEFRTQQETITKQQEERLKDREEFRTQNDTIRTLVERLVVTEDRSGALALPWRLLLTSGGCVERKWFLMWSGGVIAAVSSDTRGAYEADVDAGLVTVVEDVHDAKLSPERCAQVKEKVQVIGKILQTNHQSSLQRNPTCARARALSLSLSLSACAYVTLQLR